MWKINSSRLDGTRDEENCHLRDAFLQVSKVGMRQARLVPYSGVVMSWLDIHLLRCRTVTCSLPHIQLETTCEWPIITVQIDSLSE